MTFNYSNDYCADWDIDCLRSDYLNELERALKSGEHFDTGYHGVKHGSKSLRIHTEDDFLTVTVDDYTDDIYDLIDNYDSSLTDEELECVDMEFYDCETECEEELSTYRNDCTVSYIVEMIQYLSEKVDDSLQETLDRVAAFCDYTVAIRNI